MAEKSTKQSKRGGKRLGAGRPRGAEPVPMSGAGIDIALAGIDRALKLHEDRMRGGFSPLQHRWHLAMVLFGVPPEIVTAALFKPEVSKKFSRDIATAIEAVKAAA